MVQDPRTNKQPTGLFVALPAAVPCFSSPTGHPHKKSPLLKTADFLVGCPVGLEPTVSRSTIWRVNRLRYGHHIDAPEGTRTPGPLLRRQLLYPPELRAHVVIPLGSCMAAVCVGTRCEKYNTIRNPVCQEQFEKSFGFLCGAVTAATCRQSRRQTRGQARRLHPGYGARR